MIYGDNKKHSNLDLVYKYGDITVDSGEILNLPNVKLIMGNVFIKEGAMLTADKLTSISGVLHIDKGGSFMSQELAVVHGGVSLKDFYKFEAPELAKIKKYCIINGTSSLCLPNLRKVIGNLTVDIPDLLLPKLTYVISVLIKESSRLVADVLWEIPEDLIINDNGIFQAKALVCIGNKFQVLHKCLVDVPVLKIISKCDIYSPISLDSVEIIADYVSIHDARVSISDDAISGVYNEMYEFTSDKKYLQHCHILYRVLKEESDVFIIETLDNSEIYLFNNGIKIPYIKL